MLGAGYGPISFTHGDAVPLVPTFLPTNYLPVADGGFIAQTIHGHLKGIDNALAAAGASPWTETASVNSVGDTILHPMTLATDKVAIGVADVGSGVATDIAMLEISDAAATTSGQPTTSINLVVTGATVADPHIRLFDAGSGENASILRTGAQLQITSGTGGTMVLQEAATTHIALSNQTQLYRQTIILDNSLDTIFDFNPNATLTALAIDLRNVDGTGSGNIIEVSWGAAIAQVGHLTGLNWNFSGITGSPAWSQTGTEFTLDAMTNTGTGTVNRIGHMVACGSITMNNAFGQAHFRGVDITIPSLTRTDGTLTGYGINILGGATSGTLTAAGVNIAMTSPSPTNSHIRMVDSGSGEAGFIYRDGSALTIDSGTGAAQINIDIQGTGAFVFYKAGGAVAMQLNGGGTAAAPNIQRVDTVTTGLYWINETGTNDSLAVASDGVGAIAIRTASIPTIVAASDTAGGNTYIKTEDGGAATGNNAGVAGGRHWLYAGDGSIPAGTGVIGGNGGQLRGNGGVGAAGSATGTGGAGGSCIWTAGAGGGTSGAGTGGAGGSIILIPGAGGTTVAGTDGADGTVQVSGGFVLESSNGTEIGINVGNAALTVGSAGSIRAPYVASTASVYTDAIGGDVAGCFGFNDDTDSGPVYTLELRTDTGVDSWVSVALSGYLIQRQVPYNPGTADRYWTHDKQVWQVDDQYFVDETKCVVCGEQMRSGDQVTMWANAEGVRDDDLHCIFGHLHLDQNDDFQRLKQQVLELKLEIEQLRAVGVET